MTIKASDLSSRDAVRGSYAFEVREAKRRYFEGMRERARAFDELLAHAVEDVTPTPEAIDE